MSTTENEWKSTLHEHKGYSIHQQHHVWYEKIDERSKEPKKRRYAAKIRYLFQIIDKRNARGDSLVWGAPFEVKIKGVIAEPLVYTENEYLLEDRKTPVVSVSVAFIVKVNKPSEIPDLLDARKSVTSRVRVGDTIPECLLSGIRDALDVKLESIARVQRRDDADSLARFLARRANESAKKVINYEAEMAALEAKLEVTRKNQLAIEIQHLRDTQSGAGGVYFEGREINVRSVEAAIKHAEEAFPSNGPFDDESRRDLTKLDEV